MTSAILRSYLLGAWELSTYDVVDGVERLVAQPLGERPIGYLLYTTDGYMSAQLMRRDRPSFDVTATGGGTVAETVSAARGYLAYSGRFEVDEATGMVCHHVAVSLLPNWIHGVQIRWATQRDGMLVLTGDVSSEFGPGAMASLAWHRPT